MAMTIQDDETLQMYLEESIEHLATIENDFLEIEGDGANINEDLVNKVYRAAHSIKGGAGFMGLTNIKNLTHEMENILGKIRSREIVPTQPIVNTLLSASDTLKELMNDILNSNDKDIGEQIKALKDVLQKEPQTKPAKSKTKTKAKSTGAKNAPPKKKSPPVSKPAVQPSGDELELIFADGQDPLTITPDQVAPYIDQGKCVYLVRMSVEADILDRQKTCQGVLEEMEQTGVVLFSNFDLQPTAELDKDWMPAGQHMTVLFATILKPGDITVLFETADENVLELKADLQLYRLDGRPAGSSAAEATEAPTADEEQQIIDQSAGDMSEDMPEPTIDDDWVDQPMAPETIEAEKHPAAQENPADSAMKKNKFEHETSLRVHVSLLDQLMTLAGELVLSRNQLLQSMLSSDRRSSEVAGQRIDLITSELQEAIMLTRMQSIGNVFNKFPRVVRDLASSLGKTVELSLEGKDVELDKTIIEAIGDPLTHLVRNSVDHGIETPNIRERLGKRPTGQIYLRAYHEAGQVNIEISDDGKGLNGNKLATKAVEKGLITDEQAKVMSNHEKINLIFLPGFSTADEVTDVSGRGVGMDVVKTNLDRLGGIIDIDSEPNKGTTIRIKLPLTLAIIPCQIVVTGGERYAIPQVNLEELLRIPADQIQKRIERVGNADVVRLRGNLLPLIRLSEVIGVESYYPHPRTGGYIESRRQGIADRRAKKSPLITPEEAAQDATSNKEQPSDTQERVERNAEQRRYHAASALNIVVVSTGALKYGLVVDTLHDSEEIVVKPLGRDLKKCKGYAGATIMGDGRVALILDVSNLAHMAGLTSVENSVRAAEVAASESEAARIRRDKQSLLVFRSAENEQFAAPLSLVERIEKISRKDIEQVGGKQVIKYRGGSLPLFTIDQVADVKPLADAENLLVIVFIVSGREIGLLAIGPVDALESNLTIDGTTLRQPGIMGSAIINDSTTLLIDIVEIVQTLNPQWFKEAPVAKDPEKGAPTILFAEDSSFFRNQVKGSMEKEGFNVLEAEDGVIAWDLLKENADQISLVVTDIEMPNLDGFALTQRIKQNPSFSHLPVIALTTLAGEEDILRGKAVGIDDYQIKLDREKLIKSIHDFLKAA